MSEWIKYSNPDAKRLQFLHCTLTWLSDTTLQAYGIRLLFLHGTNGALVVCVLWSAGRHSNKTGTQTRDYSAKEFVEENTRQARASRGSRKRTIRASNDTANLTQSPRRLCACYANGAGQSLLRRTSTRIPRQEACAQRVQPPILPALLDQPGRVLDRQDRLTARRLETQPVGTVKCVRRCLPARIERTAALFYAERRAAIFCFEFAHAATLRGHHGRRTGSGEMEGACSGNVKTSGSVQTACTA